VRRRTGGFERQTGAAFNLVRFWWFKNELIHPTKPKTVYKGESLNHPFGGFSTEGR